MRGLICLFIILAGEAAAESGYFVVSDSILKLQQVQLRSWKYHPGDDTAWARPGFDDTQWETLPSGFKIGIVKEKKFMGSGWFRLRLRVDSALRGKPVALQLFQSGASEVYLNGKYAGGWGTFSRDKQLEVRFDPHGSPLLLLLNDSAVQLLAIRYSNHDADYDYEKYNRSEPGFWFMLSHFGDSIQWQQQYVLGNNVVLVFLFAFFFTLSLVHFLLFLFYRKQKLNLYYGLFTEGVAAVFLLLFIAANGSSPGINAKYLFWAGSCVVPYFFFALLGMFYSFFYSPMPRRYWLYAAVMIVYLPFIIFYPSAAPFAVPVIMFFVFFDIIRVVVISIVKKRGGAWILGGGVLFFIAALTAITIYALASGGTLAADARTASGILILVLLVLTLLSIPLSASCYLAWDFSRINRDLEKQLVQVQRLSEKTLQQEQEKKRILETQKERLETEVAHRTAEVVKQKAEIEVKNKEITDSINYAKRIQSALLPVREQIRASLPDSFVLYRPKDIVSGDFYWFHTKGDKIFIAACDCTGHGVPGALMSMIGNNLLSQAVAEKNINDPGEILSEVNRNIRRALKQTGSVGESRDGMDIAFCSLEKSSAGFSLQYAGAQRPLWIRRQNSVEMEEITPDKASLGGLTDDAVRFTTHTFNINSGDSLYLFTDGYADQFGGEKGKKMMTRRFRELLLSISSKTMEEQEKNLELEFDAWKGHREQVDDILVIGIKIK
jgi:serine phosphatase RsbU (regulator of sigma subunit)